MTLKSHKMPDKFKAYELEYDKDTGLHFARQPRIGRFKDVCFVGSNVLTMPDSVNYDYRYMKESY